MLKTDVIHAPFTRREGVMERGRGVHGILAVAAVCALCAMPLQASAFEAVHLTEFTATPGDGKVTLEWSVTGGVAWIGFEYTYSYRNTQTNEFSGVRWCSIDQCDVSGLTNGITYEFEGEACQDYYWHYQYVRTCSNKITLSATPTAE